MSTYGCLGGRSAAEPWFRGPSDCPEHYDDLNMASGSLGGHPKVPLICLEPHGKLSTLCGGMSGSDPTDLLGVVIRISPDVSGVPGKPAPRRAASWRTKRAARRRDRAPENSGGLADATSVRHHPPGLPRARKKPPDQPGDAEARGVSATCPSARRRSTDGRGRSPADRPPRPRRRARPARTTAEGGGIAPARCRVKRVSDGEEVVRHPADPRPRRRTRRRTRSCDRDPVTEILAYRTAVASVSLSRYLAEGASELGPSLLGRMMETHDFPLLFVPLVEEPPWTRRRTVSAGRRGEGGDDSGAATETKVVWEKLHYGEWREVPPTELLDLTSHEGQPWLALYHLTCSSSCRSSYGLDEYRRSRLMRVRKFLRDGRLVDQLPVLSDVARYLDELSMMAVPPSGRGAVMGASSASSTGLLLERVDVVREGIAGGNAADRYASIAEGQWADIFSGVTDAEDGTLRRIAGEVYGGAEDGVGREGGSDAWGPIERASPSVSGEEKKDDGPRGSGASATPGRSDLGSEMGEDPHSHLGPSGERWKIPLSGPVERVTLELLGDERGGSTVRAAHTFELTPSGRANVTATPLGRYGRTKMTIARSDDGNPGELGAALPPRGAWR
ncbi:hypothetical protein THAOC_00061, partial [Thalassiosira oceanica]